MSRLHYVFVVALGAVVLAGCGKEEKKATDEKKPVQVERETFGKPVPPPLQSADEQDNPEYKRLFPASEKASGWTKTEPVRGGPAGQLNEYLPKLVAALSPYKPKTVATATYKRFYDERLATAHAYLVQASNTDDAYGMLSVICPGQDDSKIGDVYRQAGDQICVARGDYLGLFEGDSTDPDDLISLAAKTMFALPGRGGAPDVVKLLQGDPLPAGRVFFLRDLSSMAGPAGKGLLGDVGLRSAEGMTQLLELGPSVAFALAAFPVKNWSGSDMVWIAKYPSAEHAHTVYLKYKSVLSEASPESKLHESTVLQQPKGPYLVGCWTAEADSLAGFLTSAVYQRLP